jgi:hypothetical protein
LNLNCATSSMNFVKYLKALKNRLSTTKGLFFFMIKSLQNNIWRDFTFYNIANEQSVI